MNAKVLKRLAALRERYTSLEQMADALRVHPGFEDLNRSTLSRWLKDPPQRAAVAVRILNSHRPATRLRMALPHALSLIPAWMLTWEAEERKPYGLLSKRCGLRTEVKPTQHGGPALEALMKGEVDLAVVPGDMLGQLGRDCRRICLVSKSYVAGIATQLIEAVSDLKGKSFGVVAGSAFATRLSEVGRTWGIEVRPPVVFQSPKDIVQALLAGQINGMIGSEPSVSQVRRAVARSLELFPIREGLLGWFEMHLAANIRTAPPNGVRCYLAALQETTDYSTARKSVAAFQAEIASRFGMDQADVRSMLTNIAFSEGPLEPVPVLALWEREVVKLRER